MDCKPGGLYAGEPVEGRLMHRMDPVELVAPSVTREALARDVLLKLIESCSLSALKGGEPGVRRIDLQLSPHGIEEREPPPGSFAAYAVSIADALLAELAKPKEGA